jgi:heme exporter protein B
LIGAAVTASVKRAGVLIALVVLPLFAPPIVFGAAVASGEEIAAAMSILAGCALGAAALGPLAAAAALRLQAE